jgi:hypothetical protein
MSINCNTAAAQLTIAIIINKFSIVFGINC